MRQDGVLWIAAGLLVLMTTPVRAAEEAGVEWDIVGGVGLGVTELKFTEKLDADPSFNTYQFFGSIGYDKAYATLNYADTLSDENVSEEDEIGEASRKDIDLTFGYRLTDHWTVFAGYKDGETELDLRVRDTDIVQNEYYREDGWYAGVSRAFRLGRAGTINLSAAYIKFDSDLRFTEGVEDDEEEEEDEPTEFDDLEGKYSGDSDGYSVGVSWVIPVGQKAAVRAQYKINDYDLEVRADGQKFTPDQRLSYFDLTLLYAF